MSERLTVLQTATARHRPRHALPAIRGAIALLASLGLALALLVPVLRFAADGEPAVSASHERARAAARAFLERYVNADGRVVRLDQGGDSVSEGVSYALLLSLAAGDERTFERVWSWADRNMRKRDGLLAYLWADGAVRDPNPASDGDLVTAWALARSGGRHARAGRRLAAAVLSHETVGRHGGLLLAAGPWATGEPVTINPSYWVSFAFEQLSDQTRDPRWSALSDSSLRLTRMLTGDGRRLPPDWGRIDGGVVAATPAPNLQAPDVRYGLDAQRLVVWLAASCDPAARALAARFWPKLSRPRRAGALALWPDGGVADGRRNPMPLVAAAAAAGAAGKPGARDRLLARAERVNAASPTYYGAAWVAIGRTLLSTSLVGGCATEAMA